MVSVVKVTRAEVESLLASVLTLVPAATVRLVGIASSVWRGIQVPANDIDILFQDRAGVDAWFGVLSADLEVDRAPTWIAESQQYTAIGGAPIGRVSNLPGHYT
jgi:hypothetical protein